MSEIVGKIEKFLKDAEQSARDGLHGRALDYLDAAEELIAGMPAIDENQAEEYRIKILNNRGIVFKNLENFDESEACFRKALSLIEEDGGLNPKLRVGVHLNLANLLSRRRLFNPALDHFHKALEAADNLKEQVAADIKCKIHNNLALFYCNFGERAKAQEELDKCLEYKGGDEFRIDFDRERQAWIRTNLGFMHSELADEKELTDDEESGTLRRAALGFFREALEIYRNIGYGLMEARTLLNIASVERRLGMKKEAVENINKSLEIANRLESERLKVMVLEQCVNYHLNTTASPFGDALDELFGLLSKSRDPFAERILRRIEDRARRAGRAEVCIRIRQKLRAAANVQGAREHVDEPVTSEGS
jgi:tetratricopeptide (TPR) repeat protein